MSDISGESVVTSCVDAGAIETRPEVIWLDNGLLRLGFVPGLGGRLLSVIVEGKEMLWRNDALLDGNLHPVGGHRPAPVAGQMRDWVNYGGDKTWIAPQGWSGTGQWPGPPDPILDSGEYRWRLSARDDGGVTLMMTSGDDPRTGVRLSRTFTLGPGSFAYDCVLTATNTCDEDIAWALWNVMQRRAGAVEDGGGVLIAVDPSKPEAVPLAIGTKAPKYLRQEPERVRVPHQSVVGKLGFPGATGWLAHLSNGTTSTVRFDVEEEATYPDHGSRAEVWMETALDSPLRHLGGLQPTDDVVELEVLGPLRSIQPGCSTSLAIRCASKIGQPDDILSVTPHGHMTTDGWVSYSSHRPAGKPSSIPTPPEETW